MHEERGSGPAGWRIEQFPELDSTNNLVRERILEAWGSPAGGGGAAGVEGLVIVAERQSQGRGQHGRSWASPRGGLYLSAVVESIPPAHRHLLALVAGVSAADALGEGVSLRWPNDLMIGGRKVGGILCESVAMGTRWAGIIGIGINVETRAEDFPAELRSGIGATSLHLEGLGRWTTDLVRARLLEALRQRLESLSNDEGMRAVIGRVRQLDCLLGHEVAAESPTGRIVGVAAGIDEQGGLMLDLPGGRERAVVRVGTVLKVDGRPLRAG